jgi:hypothetical protein
VKWALTALVPVAVALGCSTTSPAVDGGGFLGLGDEGGGCVAPTPYPCQHAGGSCSNGAECPSGQTLERELELSEDCEGSCGGAPASCCIPPPDAGDADAPKGTEADGASETGG